MQINPDLLRRYYEGKCSPEEKAAVKQWLENDFSSDVFPFDINQSVLQEDMDIIWNNVSPLLPVRGQKAEKKRLSGRVRYFIAASLLIAILGGSCFWLLQHRPAAFNTAIVQWREISNSGTDVKDVALSDGSSMRLYPQATVLVPDVAADRHRRLKLVHGKALFNIRHDASSPFTVETGRSVTEVLGTSFTVDRQSAADVVTLLSGRVSFTVSGRPSNVLYPGQQVTYDTVSGKIQIAAIAVPEKRAEVNMQFKAVLLQEVFGRLEQKFDIRFRVEDRTIYRLRYTGDLNGKSLKDVEDILSLTADLKFKEQGNTVFVSQ